MKKSGGGIGSFIFGILIVACAVLAGINFFGDDSGNMIGGNYSIDADSLELLDYEIPEHRNMYNQLDATEKIIYKEVRDAVIKGQTEVTFESVDWDVYSEAFYQAYDAVYYDFPEFFWLNSGWRASASYSSKGGYDMTVELGCYDYWQYTTEKDEYIEAAISEARIIASAANAFETDYEKVKFVHDYLIVSAEYDYVCLEELNQTVQRASSQQSHTIYGCLVNKVCVCDGYAKSFQLIMSMLGIQCEYVEGDAGGGHAWNYVVLDGDEYWMDITWDENETVDEDGDLIAPYGAQYDYFCVTDNVLYQTHVPDPTFEIPVCDSTEYNFFYQEKSYLETYDFNAFCEGIKEQADSQIIQIKFGSEEELTKARTDLNGGKWKLVPGIDTNNAVVYYSNTSCVLYIYLP